MTAKSDFNGILLMNKPAGFTSHDVVAKLRGILRTRRIGHGGTLDPMATGVLPVFVGGATRAADFSASQDKEYIAGFALGFATDTQDTTGQVLTSTEKKATEEQVRSALNSFLGAQQQLPPMYSAVKVNGRKLYDLARKGQEVERPTRDIFVHEIELLGFDSSTQQGSFRIVASKGTYVRTVIHDLGERLGTLAAMNHLVRTRAGAYPLEQTLGFEEVQTAVEEQNMQTLLRPTDSLFLQYPPLYLTEEGVERILRGAVVFPRQTQGMPEEENALLRVYNGETFLMLGQVRTLDIGGLGLFVYKNFR